MSIRSKVSFPPMSHDLPVPVRRMKRRLSGEAAVNSLITFARSGVDSIPITSPAT
jgi:hypothetical protein